MAPNGSGFQIASQNSLPSNKSKNALISSTDKTDNRISEHLTKSTDKTDNSPADVLSKFADLVRHFGTDHGVLLDSSEILTELDADGIECLETASLEVRQSWAKAIALRLIRHRGIVPTDWTKIAHCHFCGPVYSYHDLNMLSCDWCDMRVAGKSFPQPDLEERTA
jgi:hypothetical protein